MFTAEQSVRMDATLHTVRASLLASDGLVPPTGVSVHRPLVQGRLRRHGRRARRLGPADVGQRRHLGAQRQQRHRQPGPPEPGARLGDHVRVRPRAQPGVLGQRASGTVRLYWAKASTGLSWPAPWDGSVTTPALMGGSIGSPTGVGHRRRRRDPGVPVVAAGPGRLRRLRRRPRPLLPAVAHRDGDRAGRSAWRWRRRPTSRRTSGTTTTSSGRTSPSSTTSPVGPRERGDRRQLRAQAPARAPGVLDASRRGALDLRLGPGVVRGHRRVRGALAQGRPRRRRCRAGRRAHLPGAGRRCPRGTDGASRQGGRGAAPAVRADGEGAARRGHRRPRPRPADRRGSRRRATVLGQAPARPPWPGPRPGPTTSTAWAGTPADPCCC